MIAYKTKFKRKDDTIYYNEKTWQSERVLWSVLVNAYDTLADVYIFENFDKYCEQLKSDKQEDKKQEYWKVGRKKLIDSVSISIAFENINKAILQRNGFLIHKII